MTIINIYDRLVKYDCYASNMSNTNLQHIDN